jgi:DNA-binding transcriptional LysR family regulator
VVSSRVFVLSETTLVDRPCQHWTYNLNTLYVPSKQSTNGPMQAHMNLNRLAYFTAVVDTGSFTAAAARLGITKAVVSQQVARLEEELGTRLLVRTTRRVEPTDAGRAFHVRCVVILRQSEDAFVEMGRGAESPTGTLRLTAPLDYGTAVVVPALAEFTRRYPACRAELSLSDKTIDLASGQLDMAIRVGWLEDSSFVARRIGSFQQFLVCAPSFAGALSRVRKPEDLQALPFIANTALRKPLDWKFSRPNAQPRAVRGRSTFAIDTTPAVHAAVLAGAGLSVLPDYVVHADVALGRLLHVLPGWSLPTGGIHAVFPAARLRPAKVSAFLDLLTDQEKRTEAASSATSSRTADAPLGRRAGKRS